MSNKAVFPVNQTLCDSPFGLRQNRYINANYRYGYQGDFADDETEESGYNVFEARLYDPVIGRWISVDPARQYASGYVGMGNNPVNGVDPDGNEWYRNLTTNEEKWFLGVSGEIKGWESLGFISGLGYDFDAIGLEEIVITPTKLEVLEDQKSAMIDAVHSGQSEFLDHGATKMTAGFAITLISGPACWVGYGIHFAKNTITNQGDWKKGFDGIDYFDLALNKVPGSSVYANFAKNTVGQFVDLTGKDGLAFKNPTEKGLYGAVAQTGIDGLKLKYGTDFFKAWF
ncbi:RHS repeat-associated core domain-containing protein [Persicobacter diffluens]|uniref:RHS repeat-associated core domain-containing protein n=1 Tax=Persicobacter diffluens TaxID=981 RepID=A0AAN4W438_9BACT|nr:hypothetical protein PEDI_42170 [Persicobacter diffluens]